MSKMDSPADWNQMIEDREDDIGLDQQDEGKDNVGVGVVIVEHPQTPPKEGRYTVFGGEGFHATSDEDEEADILDLNCGELESTISDVSDSENTHSLRTLKKTSSVCGVSVPLISTRFKGKATTVDATTTVELSTVKRSATRSPPQVTRKQRRRQEPSRAYTLRGNRRRALSSRGAANGVVRPVFDRQTTARSTATRRDRVGHEILTHQSRWKPTPSDDRSNWNVRWLRAGFQNLVYAVCNCTETPNVIFAGLCYQSRDVYTMVLRNCNGKSRYWYDKTTRRGGRRVGNGELIGDFERAMMWRANAIGRSWTSPGYDLSSFVLQHVATDKRSRDRSDTTLIIVTTNDTLTDPTISGQLVYSDDESTNRHRRGSRQTSTQCYWDRKQQEIERRLEKSCCVCRAPPGIVTLDNASLPTFTCWQHSTSHLGGASADLTRVCDVVVVDMQFLYDETADEVVCRLHLVKSDADRTDGWRDVITIAEIVLLPANVHHSEMWTRQPDFTTSDTVTSARSVDLSAVHASCCRDGHYNDEDLFPSMPINGLGGGSSAGPVKHYDTTVGRVVDRIFCLASKFQR